MKALIDGRVLGKLLEEPLLNGSKLEGYEGKNINIVS